MKIGVFDSGYGGLTILSEIRKALPEYDYIYLGDNARAPYGTRSFECIYQYTLQSVQYLREQGCRLVILACNTASAKALRTIQQRDIDPTTFRVLGVIRPTVEAVTADYPESDKLAEQPRIGILATPGTVSSCSYPIEIEHLNPAAIVTQQACPMFVPLIEAGEHESPAADYFVHQYLYGLFMQDPLIDTIILGCTHYPLLLPKIQDALSNLTAHAPSLNHLNPDSVRVITQGPIVAASLKDYLHRHPEIVADLTTNGTCKYLTTDNPDSFASAASLFIAQPIHADHIELT